MERFRDFEEFWPHYLSEHSRPGTRRLHLAGTLLALLVTLLAVVLRRWWLVLLAPVVGYGLSWIGHGFVERNRPATFRHPLWSLRGDLRMIRLMLTGGLKHERPD